MEQWIATNLAFWDEVTPLHVASDFYDNASFKAGRSSLLPVERAELGDVRGKTMLHLQCHFGQDSLSWAREGAIVTGVDFAPNAIAQARALAAEMKIDARFIEMDVYRLLEVLEGAFDIVYASYGVLIWLPDLPAWARIAASYVKPGGVLYLLDGHPILAALDDTPGAGFSLAYDYLGSGRPLPYPDGDGSYAAPDSHLQHTKTAEFAHPLSEIVTSVIEAGLRIEYLHEFPFAMSRSLPAMEKSPDGYYRAPGNESVPFLFSLKATKPA